MQLESYKTILRNYIRAKDDNKPHLMQRVFTDSATLAMKLKTDAISFPADSVGLTEITDVLVRNFSQSYENVYTFCLTDSFTQAKPSPDLNLNLNRVSCDWLVCMTGRANGNVRVGCGRYDWYFNDDVTLANRLVITIEQMKILAPDTYKEVMEWIELLSYPFCDSDSVLKGLPEIESLESIRNLLLETDIEGT